MIFSMRHKLNSEPHKFLDRVISLPSPVGVFDLLVMLIMLKCKKVPLDLNKRKHLNVFVNLLPHCLSCYNGSLCLCICVACRSFLMGNVAAYPMS
jgi:hypothetical protein